MALCRGKVGWKWTIVRAVLLALPALAMTIGHVGEVVAAWLDQHLPRACVKQRNNDGK